MNCQTKRGVRNFYFKRQKINAGKVIAQIHLLNIPLLFKLEKKSKPNFGENKKKKVLKKIRATDVAAIKYCSKVEVFF